MDNLLRTDYLTFSVICFSILFVIFLVFMIFTEYQTKKYSPTTILWHLYGKRHKKKRKCG